MSIATVRQWGSGLGTDIVLQSRRLRPETLFGGCSQRPRRIPCMFKRGHSQSARGRDKIHRRPGWQQAGMVGFRCGLIGAAEAGGWASRSLRALGWLSRPFRSFSVFPFCRFTVLPLWYYARSVMLPAFRFADLSSASVSKSVCFRFKG